ncbi:winged helix-turn-helix domain-containing protein [Streptomyces sp. NPDC020379]|uniref:winged helix-turn-helix domain-containing protein n=1 Tax=Streptomyces sp. NPDC020379 TaxID=3365071 RepID=UPI0037BC0E80
MRASAVERVELIRWPVESDRRERCRDRGVMRILVLEAGAEAPLCVDLKEDWVRAPVSADDLRARAEALRIRAAAAESRPEVDPNGVLRFRWRSALLSPTEARLVARLTESYAEVVTRDDLLRLPQGRTVPSRNALDLHIMRIRRRLAALGLRVRTVRGRGYVLESAESGEGGEGD